MQQFSRHLGLGFLTMVLSIQALALVNDNSSVEAFVCQGDCVTPTFTELAIQRDLRDQGYKTQKVAVFLNEDGTDPRQEIKAKDKIPGLGRVRIKTVIDGRSFLAGVASGYMINKCLMMTNKHVVQDKPEYKVTQIEFEAGLSFQGTAKNANVIGGQLVDSGEYNKDDVRTFHEDWAVVKLDKNIGNEIGFLEPMFSDEADLLKAQDLNVFGLIEDDLNSALKAKGAMQLQKHVECFSKGYNYDEISAGKKMINTGGVMTNCSSMPGTSGSAIARKDFENKYRSVGIMRNSYEHEKLDQWDETQTNVFVPFVKKPSTPQSLSEDRLKKIIEENTCTASI